MNSANLSNSSGLFPAGVRELLLRGLDSDLFCWVMTEDWAKDRLMALPDSREAAQAELAATLARDHGFASANAELAAQSLFDLAFQGVPEATGREIGERMPRPRIEATQQNAQAASLHW